MRSLVLAAEGAGFTPPSSREFFPPAVFSVGGFAVTRILLLVVATAVVLAVFFWLAARPAALVPGRLQFVGEGVYGFVRNSIAREVIGSRDFRTYVPYLATLFSFILLNNLLGIIPFIQFPTMSKFGLPLFLAIISWLLYNIVGIRRQGGILPYLRLQSLPPGMPGWIKPLIIPLEFASNILVRPVTLSLRLFANMFAGHLLLLVFALGGEYLLVESAGLLPKLLSPFAFLLFIVMTFFEALVQVLQAYIFTLLSALYVAGALAEEH